MEKEPSESATTMEVVDLEKLGGQAMREAFIATIVSFAIGEALFRLEFLCWCKHHTIYLLACVFLGTFLCFESGAYFLGANRFGQRDRRMVKWAWIRWLFLVIGPVIASLVTDDSIGR